MTITEKEYRNHPAISRSELWRMHESPEKFKYYRDNPQDPTPALIFGQVAHKLLLEPDTFNQEFVVAPEIDRRTKVGKAEWAEFLQSADGKTVVSKDDYETAKAMVAKCLSYPAIVDLLKGNHEKPYFWTDELTGEACKCRVDSINPETRTIIDYKTTSNASTAAFQHSIDSWGYDFQAAMYLYGAREDADNFSFIAQEKTPPYSVNIIPVSEEMRLRGIEIYMNLMQTYHYCMETGDWFGPLGAKDNELFRRMTSTSRNDDTAVMDKLPWE